MSFWNQGDANPKRKFRFRVEIVSSGWNGTAIWYAKSCTAPSVEVSSVEHMFSDHVFNFPGKAKWGDVEMVLVDPGGDMGYTGPSTVENFNTLLTLFGYDPPADGVTAAEYGTIARNKLQGAAIVISALDDNGGVLETWQLANAFPIAFKYGDFDYGTDDLREMNITWKYDHATCKLNTAASAGTTFFQP